jgi:hypothetical protein
MTDLTDQMDTDHEVTCSSESRTKSVSWSADTGVASLSKELFSHLQTYKESATKSGEVEPDLPVYEQPKDQIITKEKINQRIRLNLIHHCGTVADIPTIKLFKSFVTALCQKKYHILLLPL